MMDEKKQKLPSLVFRVYSLTEKDFFLYLITILITGFAFPCINIFFAFAYKNISNSIEFGNPELFLHSVYIIFAAIIIQCLIEPIANYVNGRIVNKIICRIKCNVFSHITRLPMRYFDKTHSGDLISRINNDLNKFEPLYRGDIRNLCHALFYGLVAIVSMVWLDIYVAVMVICLGLLNTLIGVLYAKPLRKIADSVQKKMAALTELFIDIVRGFLVLKIFNVKHLILDKFTASTRALRDETVHSVRKKAEIDAINMFMNLLNVILILTVGSLQVSRGAVDIGTIIAIIVLQNGVSYMFSQIGSFFANIQDSLSGANRIFELMDEPAESGGYNTKGCRQHAHMIVLENIDFRYNETKQILSGVSLNIPENKLTAIVGPSGSGKSTVLKIIAGLYKPQNGCMSINGKALEQYSLQELRDIISYISQDNLLFKGTIAENIRYGKPGAAFTEIQEAAKAACAHNFIMELPEGYNYYLGESGYGLSTGQKQRIAIARAFLKSAPIILLDEPTSSLDFESENLVNQAIAELIKGRTAVLVSHRKATIECSDYIYVVKNGRITKEGNFRQLFG